MVVAAAVVGSGGAGADLGQVVADHPVSAQIPAALRGESGGYAVAIMVRIGAAALIGYLYSIMSDRFDTPNFVITAAACWASRVPSGQGSASMSRSTAGLGSLATSVSTTGGIILPAPRHPMGSITSCAAAVQTRSRRPTPTVKPPAL